MEYWGHLVISLLFRRRRKMKKENSVSRGTPIRKMTLRTIDSLKLSSRGFIQDDIEPAFWHTSHHHIFNKGFIPKEYLHEAFDGWWHTAFQYYGENDDYYSSLKILQERNTGEIILYEQGLRQPIAAEEDAIRIFFEKVDEMTS